MKSVSEGQNLDVIIIGGGLGGLISGHLLVKQGLKVALIEKKKYPFHRVCGEYISNEVIPFLKSHDLFPENLAPSKINKFKLTSISGDVLDMPLDLGGFGISRYAYDEWLAREFIKKGGQLLEKKTVRDVEYDGSSFLVKIEEVPYKAKMVIGAFGKRSIMDKQLKRDFLKKPSPYIGVKYHIKINYQDDIVALHNFKGGYCGINKVEGEAYNLCYLSSRSNLQAHGSIPEMEEKILFRNPHLKSIFQDAEFLFEKPEVINEISFEKKGALYNNIPMVGDAAGMITPLCGNGMAMAIHAAKILSETILKHWEEDNYLHKINQSYVKKWNTHFSGRLWVGRKVQSLFGGERTSNFAVSLGKKSRPIANYLMSKTHGVPFS